MVPDRADTWTRMVYSGPNKPVTPIDDPYQMFNKLYGRMKDQESLKSILDALGDDLSKVRSVVSGAEDRHLLEEHATFVREMENELKASANQNDALSHAVPGARAGRQGRERRDPRISKMQIDLMVNQLRLRLRPCRHLAIHQLGGQGEDAAAEGRRRAP